MAEFMTDKWLGLTSDKVYKMWSELDPIKGITSESGFFNNSPLLEYLLSMLDGKKVLKRVIVSANDVNTGSYRQIRLHEIDPENLLYIASAVVGSASIPFVFPPMNMSPFGLDSLLIDGGTSWNNNMISGI
jgi:predicted acylesterase/phospholipase RssA